MLRALSIVVLAFAFLSTSFVLDSLYKQKAEQINVVGRQNLEDAVIWQFSNSLLDSGIIDDIAQFTVDYYYLGSSISGGASNIKTFNDQILEDYQGLINASSLINASVAIFIDDKLIYINGGTVSYSGKRAPYTIYTSVYYLPIGFIIIPIYEYYAVYDLKNAGFRESTLGTIVNATPINDITPRGYCIHVEGTIANGTICYAKKITLPYVVETQHKWGGYNFTVYWGEKGVYKG